MTEYHTTAMPTQHTDRQMNRITVLKMLAVFLLALAPRVLALQQFVTADEAKWVYRSAQFLGAVLRADFAATAVNLTPAVTTTWLGSLGLLGHYQAHQAEIGLPLADWLAALPPFRAEVALLAGLRWPMALFTALAIAVIYLWARRLWGDRIALPGAALIALDPHTLALSRIIGHDGPAAMFMTLSLLALLNATEERAKVKTGWLITAGAMAGLAMLSKSPALFLLPFTGLLLLRRAWPAGRTGPADRPSQILTALLKSGTWWGLTAYAVIFICWPAVWVAPLQQPWAVVENAFLSAANLDEVAAGQSQEEDTYWLIPDLGPAYYPVNGAFKLSPLVSLGLLIGLGWWLRSGKNRAWFSQQAGWLALFAGLFLLFMTAGGKRSSRYILPIFPSLALLAVFGWYRLKLAGRRLRLGAAVTAALGVGLLTLLPYQPYYFTYFNPLLGGPLLAPKLVSVGWGEGLDQVGRWLNEQPQPDSSRVGSWYASSLAPFYRGDIADVSSEGLDYVVIYLKQLQAGRPSPEIAGYFQQLEPLHTVRLAGIEYARIYPGPAVRPVAATASAGPVVSAATAGPVAFRAQPDYAPIGQPLTVDLLWAEGVAPPDPTPPLSLHWQGVSMARTAEGEQLFEAPAGRRYQLVVPADLPPDPVGLYAGEQLLGSLEAFHTAPPRYFSPAAVTFGDQIELVGFDPNAKIENGQVTARLAFRAAPKAWADYAVFVHFITPAGERLAGFDAQPNPPTSQWAKNQVVLAAHPISLPPDLSPNQTYQLRLGLYHAQTLEPLGQPYLLPLELRLP